MFRYDAALSLSSGATDINFSPVYVLPLMICSGDRFLLAFLSFVSLSQSWRIPMNLNESGADCNRD